MSSSLAPDPERRFKLLIFYLLIAMAFVGISMRFVKLDLHTIWHDEVCTLRRILGHRDLLTHGLKEFNQIQQGESIPLDNLAKGLKQAEDISFNNVVLGLLEAPEHTPLYYIIAYRWALALGSDIATLRLLSALSYIFLAISIFLLCKELSESRTFAILSVALVSFSPRLLTYSRFSREYVLWSALIVLSCWLLLRLTKDRHSTQMLSNTDSKDQTINNTDPYQWYVYGMVSGCALLTSYCSVLYFAAQAVFLFCTGHLRNIKTARLYISSMGIACLFVLPWILLTEWSVFFRRASWRWLDISFSYRLKAVLQQLQSVTIDCFSFSQFSYFSSQGGTSFFIGAVIIAIYIYATYCVYRGINNRKGLIVASNFIVPYLMLFSSDLIFGGIQTFQVHYTLPSDVFLIIAVASIPCLRSVSLPSRVLNSSTAILVLCCGVLSSWCYFNSHCSSKTLSSCDHFALAELINGVPEIHVVVEGKEIHGLDDMNLLSLASYIEPNHKVKFSRSWNESITTPLVVLFNPTPDLFTQVKNHIGRGLLQVGSNNIENHSPQLYRSYYYMNHIDTKR